jgi:hypothetical protein
MASSNLDVCGLAGGVGLQDVHEGVYTSHTHATSPATRSKCACERIEQNHTLKTTNLISPP